ncbi:MAG: class I SAM-dependent methyltransferase [bacterium]|nr:class I SAM-dependent methyltransferase [bacterium]
MKNLISFHNIQVKRYNKDGLDMPVNPIRKKLMLDLTGRNKKVLDLGCYYYLFDKQLIDNDNEVYGLDLSPKVLQRAKRVGVKAYLCNIETDKWPVKANFFDTVIAGEVVEHMLDTDQFLQNIGRVLKKSGTLVLTTPNLASLGRRLLLLLGRNPVIETSLNIEMGGHVRYFVKESLYILLEQNGFQIEEFTSDVILFNETQTLYSSSLAKTFPTLGKSLIIRARKI